jgi:uncharacterized protein DUF1524
VLKATKAAERAGASIVSAIETNLMATATDNLTWPNDQDVEAHSWDASSNGASQERIRMLLGALDAQMQADHPKGEKPTFNYDVLHIEHRLPQAWQPNWPVSADSDSQRSVREQQQRAGKEPSGNLTLLTAPLNSSVSNGKSSDKRSETAKCRAVQVEPRAAGGDFRTADPTTWPVGGTSSTGTRLTGDSKQLTRL